MKHAILKKSLKSISIIVLSFINLLAAKEMSRVSTEGNRFILEGREFRIKGIDLDNHAWGDYIGSKSDSLEYIGKNPFIKPTQLRKNDITFDDVQRIILTNVNTVHYGFTYSMFAADNLKRDENMQQMLRHIKLLSDNGIYTILNNRFAPGLSGELLRYEQNYHGDERVQSVFESDSLFELWAEMWEYIAEKCEGENAVIGMTLIGEPIMPSRKSGSLEYFKNLYLKLVNIIHAVDPGKIVFIPEFNSREANIGESYYVLKNGKYVSGIDEGEQGIRCEPTTCIIPEVKKNIAYIFKTFASYNFFRNGTSDFDRQKIEEAISEKISSYGDSVPLICGEYGVSYLQKAQNGNQLQWFRAVHDEFDKYKLSSIFNKYKGDITPCSGFSNNFSLWGELTMIDRFIKYTPQGYAYKNERIEKAAEATSFDKLYKIYYYDNSSSVSLMGNENLLKELQRYSRSDNYLRISSKEARGIAVSLINDNNNLLVTFDNENISNADIEITDMKGRMFMKRKLKGSKWHLVNLPKFSTKELVVSVKSDCGFHSQKILSF